MSANGETMASNTKDQINYVCYVDPVSGLSRMGHMDIDKKTIQPFAFTSGTPITNLYQVIEAQHTVTSGDIIQSNSVKILPCISGRDVLCVGKNYAEHAKEFNSSGYDSSDKVDQPTHPVIFTKRATSIIADGEEIYPHLGFTESADYEGEIGVIIGKAGFKISEEDAMDYVWGYTIVNDMTARERQRDHKQFYIGKSPDTFCPVGPIAVAAKYLPKVLRVQTHVNGELRQNATTEDLIFSIPNLIKTMSEGQTLQPGDMLATGTPAGVGIGKKPPVFLKPGDEIIVSVTGLGTLRNKISSSTSTNATVERVQNQTSIPETNIAKSCNGVGLSNFGGKKLYYRHIGSSSPSASQIVFVHGLGGTNDFWTPLISALDLSSSHSLHLYDLEGHGLSPTSPLSKLSITSFASDLASLFQTANITSGATLIAHSMGCLIALSFILSNPGLISKLILLGPVPNPLPEAGVKASHARTHLARTKGMAAVVDTIVTVGTSEQTKKQNSLAVAAVRMSLLGQDPESYAKACSALAEATETFDMRSVGVETLIVTGQDDKIAAPAVCDELAKTLPKCRKPVVLSGVGHWHVFEDCAGVADAVKGFL